MHVFFDLMQKGVQDPLFGGDDLGFEEEKGGDGMCQYIYVRRFYSRI